METKVKLKKTKDNAIVTTTVHLEKEVYKRMNDLSYSARIPKKAIINTAIEKLLDDIELYGLDVE